MVQHSKTNIMASIPITSWPIDGETMKTVKDFILRGSKITSYSDCSHEIKIIASGPTTLWQIDEETMETVTDFILLGSKITVDGEDSHEIKR